jgi:hypothetical protein
LFFLGNNQRKKEISQKGWVTSRWQERTHQIGNNFFRRISWNGDSEKNIFKKRSLWSQSLKQPM